MKRTIISFVLAALTLCSYARDARHRTSGTVVQDVLAAVPCRDTSVFYSEFGSLAEFAPESVTLLASSLIPEEVALRTRIEYALSGLAVFVSSDRGVAYRSAVADGFREAIAATEDEVLKTFLGMQLRIADPSSSAAPARLAPDYTYPKAPKVSQKKFDRMTPAQKADVLYWTGESRDTTKQDFVIAQMTSGSAEVAQAAAVAASKMGTPRAMAALIDVLGPTMPDIPADGEVPVMVTYDANGNKIEYYKTVLSEQEEAEGFYLLFDGQDMSQWEGDLDGYKAVGGCINVDSQFGGNLYTKKEYRNFIYRFEFCFLKPAVNNGVGIRTPEGVDAAYEGMCEVQILDHDDPCYSWLNEYQVHGSVYGVIPAKRLVHKPLGEWSTEEIIVDGDNVKVTVNGEVILEGNVREACGGHNVAPDGAKENPYTADHQNHPGLFNEKGHISFCGHGTGLQFRNIRIKELK